MARSHIVRFGLIAMQAISLSISPFPQFVAISITYILDIHSIFTSHGLLGSAVGQWRYSRVALWTSADCELYSGSRPRLSRWSVFMWIYCALFAILFGWSNDTQSAARRYLVIREWRDSSGSIMPTCPIKKLAESRPWINLTPYCDSRSERSCAWRTDRSMGEPL